MLTLLARAHELPALLSAMVNQRELDRKSHLALTADALLNASRYSLDGGYSISHSLLHGWEGGYVETTGYIVPTVFDLSVFLGRPELRADALKQGEWLLQHQLPDGSFRDITREQGAAFDTGQVLMGLDRLYAETGEKRFAEAGSRACDWLCALARPDGSWAGSSDTQARCPTYLTRSAAALIAHGQATGVDRYVQQGSRFLDWALTQQLPNGLFPNSELIPGAPFLLHTMVYVLEGLLAGYDLTGEARYLEAARSGAAPLLDICLNREVTLNTFYDESFNALTRQKCLTGLAQWAGLCLRLWEITGETAYATAASNALFYVQSKQLRIDGPLRGALPGSIPIWGQYLKLGYPSWNLKFFADALLAAERLGLDEKRQQETFVATSHHISSRLVGWDNASTELTEVDQRVLQRLEKVVADTTGGAQPVVVDLGCGEGRYLDWLEAKHPDWRLIGIDPQPPSHTARAIERGSANQIPLAAASADCVYASIALQHVGDIEAALVEVRRVLKPTGLFVIFDRNPISLRGLLKPWHELRGRWLYSWDSPFRERWYDLGRWRRLLRQAGFTVMEARAMSIRNGAGWRRFLPINRFVYVVARAPARSATPSALAA